MSLMDDLTFVATTKISSEGRREAFMRLHAFIEAHQPWLPPKMDGFGPWIEYKPEDTPPPGKVEIVILRRVDRSEKTFTYFIRPANRFRWNWIETDGDVVAYCVKEDSSS